MAVLLFSDGNDTVYLLTLPDGPSIRLDLQAVLFSGAKKLPLRVRKAFLSTPSTGLMFDSSRAGKS